MFIVFKLLADGAFVCGDTESRATCYAYPTSPFAEQAKKTPETVAADMMRDEPLWPRSSPEIRNHDNRNWARLQPVKAGPIAREVMRHISVERKVGLLPTPRYLAYSRARAAIPIDAPFCRSIEYFQAMLESDEAVPANRRVIQARLWAQE